MKKSAYLAKPVLAVLACGVLLGACQQTAQQQRDLAKFNAARDARAATANTDR
jgi:putative hemolysin